MIVNSFGWHLSQTVHDHETLAVSAPWHERHLARELASRYEPATADLPAGSRTRGGPA